MIKTNEYKNFNGYTGDNYKVGLSKPLSELTADDIINYDKYLCGAINNYVNVSYVGKIAQISLPEDSTNKPLFSTDTTWDSTFWCSQPPKKDFYIRSLLLNVPLNKRDRNNNFSVADTNVKIVTELNEMQDMFISTKIGKDGDQNPYETNTEAGWLSTGRISKNYHDTLTDYSYIVPIWAITDGTYLWLTSGSIYHSYYVNYGNNLTNQGFINGIGEFTNGNNMAFSWSINPNFTNEPVKSIDLISASDIPYELTLNDKTFGISMTYGASNYQPRGTFWFNNNIKSNTTPFGENNQFIDITAYYGMYMRSSVKKDGEYIWYKPIITEGMVTGYTTDMSAKSDIDDWDILENHNIPITPPKKPGGDGEYEESEYKGPGWLGSDYVSINTGLIYRKMTSAQMDDFRGIIEVLKSYNMAYTQYMRNAASAGIKKDIAEENWKATFPSVADYTASIYSKYGYGSDPVNSIISIIAFPCNIPSTVNLPIKDIGAVDLYISIPVGYTVSGEVEFVNVNYYTASGDYGTVHSYPMVSQDSFKIQLASYTITHPKGYTDFRAYAPYTRLELYIPMHGTIDLDPAVVMGKTLSVILYVTVADGSSVANVLINGDIYQTINGQVGYSVPLSVDASSTNNLALKSLSAQSQSQRLNAIGNIIHGLGSTATSIATGNYGSALGSAVDTIMTGQQNAINTRAIKYQIEHATDGKIVVGQPSSLNGFMVHPKCKLIWHLPLMQGYDSSIYGKTVGYKCHKTATLGSLSGYTECSNAVLDNVSCTEAEKAIILEQLKNGIII